MGLGKTLQTISFLGYLRYMRNIDGPFIVIVPKSTVDNWRREFERWTPEVNTFILQGDKETRPQLIKDRLLACDFDVCITSYEMVIREKAQLKKFAWEYIIVDEAHRIKNEESALSQIIRLFYSRNRLLITGTPLQNNLHELWALLNFLLPDVFGDSVAFDQWFEASEDNNQDDMVQQLHKVLSPFLLRRVKADVEKSLLPKKEVNLYIKMTDMQIKWYKKLLEKDIDAVNGAVGKREGKTRLLNIVMQLRKCCNHPYLFEGAEPGPPYTTDEHLVYNSGKMIILDKLLKRAKVNGSRILIFSQMSRMLDILEDYCYLREYEYCRIDGSTHHEDRIAAIDEYNKPDSTKFVFLLTTRAGGLGINLTTADTVILYDSDWNPQADLQAMDRAHRIGQTRQVYVYRFVTENAIEEKVLDRAAQKLRLDQLVIQQGRSTQQTKNTNNSKDELLKMIQHGAQAVFETQNPEKDSSKAADDIDIDSILKQGEERTAALNSKFSKLGLDDLQKFTSDSSAYEWNGQDFAKKNKPETFTWINPSKRERKEQTYSIDSYYKDMLSTKSNQGTRTPRPPKNIHMQDHQFYPPGLKSLLDKELLYYRHSINYKVTIAEINELEDENDNDDNTNNDENNDENNTDEDKNSENQNTKTKEQRRKEQQKLIDDAVPLTPEEDEQKKSMISEGFGEWSRRDFTNFIHLAARYGRSSYNNIAAEYDDKTIEDVRKYAEAFWKRFREIDGWEKYIAQIEAGEKRSSRLLHQQQLLRQKVIQYRVPMNEFIIQYPLNNSKRVYTEEEDRFILLMVDKFGLLTPKLWEKIKLEITKSPLFKFDWFFNSRSPVELSRRASTLLLAITREFEGPDAMKRKSGPKYSKLGSSKGDSMDTDDDDEENQLNEDLAGTPRSPSESGTPQPKNLKRGRVDIVKSMEKKRRSM